jgi:hypothetical protein
MENIDKYQFKHSSKNLFVLVFRIERAVHQICAIILCNFALNCVLHDCHIHIQKAENGFGSLDWASCNEINMMPGGD